MITIASQAAGVGIILLMFLTVVGVFWLVCCSCDFIISFRYKNGFVFALNQCCFLPSFGLVSLLAWVWPGPGLPELGFTIFGSV